jgi:hypothetical protein
MYVVSISRFQKWLVVDVLDFQIELFVDILTFLAWTEFGLLFEKMGIF